MKKKIVDYLTPVLQKASEEDLRVIGVGAFGSNLAYLISAQPKIIADFKDALDIEEESYADRMISHYIIDWVESYGKSSSAKSEEIVTFKDSTPERQLSVSEIVKEAKELRKKFKGL